jgi:type IV secretory pathway TrbF-like protein
VLERPPAEEDAYAAAQFRDVDESQRDRKAATSWRRLASGLVLGYVVLGGALWSLATRPPTAAVVYRETSRGLSYEGEAQQNLAPDELAIEAQLGAYVKAYRDVPGPDYALINRDVDLVLQTTADDPQAHVHARADALAYFNAAETNPKILGNDETRTVLDPVIASPIPTTNTWMLTWAEETDKNGVKSRKLYSGSVTIAPNPHIPTDRQKAALNPAGILIIVSALHV